jgi:hypothetical protein
MSRKSTVVHEKYVVRLICPGVPWIAEVKVAWLALDLLALGELRSFQSFRQLGLHKETGVHANKIRVIIDLLVTDSNGYTVLACGVSFESARIL